MEQNGTLARSNGQISKLLQQPHPPHGAATRESLSPIKRPQTKPFKLHNDGFLRLQRKRDFIVRLWLQRHLLLRQRSLHRPEVNVTRSMLNCIPTLSPCFAADMSPERKP